MIVHAVGLRQADGTALARFTLESKVSIKNRRLVLALVIPP